MELRSLHHCVYRLHYHLVLVTKYRRPVLTGEMLDFLREHFGRVLARWGCRLVEFSGEADHVHLLFEAHPNLRLSALVCNLKTTSSRRLRRVFRDRVRRFYRRPVFWHQSYCIISAGGVPLEVLREYIRRQERPE